MSASAPASLTPRRPPARWAKLAAVCCSLLVLLLPTVVVGLSLATPASEAELTRVERVIRQRNVTKRVDTSGSRMFHTATIADKPWPADAKAQQALIVQARLMQVLGITALAFLTYLAVLLARGRLQALLACALLAVLPPVMNAGHVLRAETPATLFALMSLILLQVASRPAPRHRYRSPRRSTMVGCGLMFCAAAMAGMACETMPGIGATLLVPGLVLLVASAQLLPRGIRCWRRRGLDGLPIHSLNRRLIPWTATALVAPAITLWLLRSTLTVSVEELAITERTSTLLPADGLGYGAAMLLLLVGLVAGVLRVGLRLGRGGRIGADLILLVYCAAFLMSWWLGESRYDPLPVLPAMAVLLSEGLRTLLVLLLGVLRRR